MQQEYLWNLTNIEHMVSFYMINCEFKVKTESFIAAQNMDYQELSGPHMCADGCHTWFRIDTEGRADQHKKKYLHTVNRDRRHG